MKGRWASDTLCRHVKSRIWFPGRLLDLCDQSSRPHEVHRTLLPTTSAAAGLWSWPGGGKERWRACSKRERCHEQVTSTLRLSTAQSEVCHIEEVHALNIVCYILLRKGNNIMTKTRLCMTMPQQSRHGGHRSCLPVALWSSRARGPSLVGWVHMGAFRGSWGAATCLEQHELAALQPRHPSCQPTCPSRASNLSSTSENHLRQGPFPKPPLSHLLQWSCCWHHQGIGKTWKLSPQGVQDRARNSSSRLSRRGT